MISRSFPGRAFLLAAFFFVWCVCPARSAAFPLVRGNALYVGKYQRDGQAGSVLLYLGAPQGFLLREEIVLPGGKTSSWETTGKWHQIRGGAFVQLTNDSGFYRLINVGGSGDLYLGMQLPTGMQITATLRPRYETPPEYEVSGELRLSGAKILFDDAASGVTYTVRADDVVTQFLQRNAAENTAVLPVGARIVPAVGGNDLPAVRVKKLWITSLEKNREYDIAGYFLDAIADKRWKVTRLGDEYPQATYLLSFVPDQGKTGGRLELFDGGRYITGTYTLHEANLSLSADTADIRFSDLLRYTRSWELAGEVLELWHGKRLLALLEKVR